MVVDPTAFEQRIIELTRQVAKEFSARLDARGLAYAVDPLHVHHGGLDESDYSSEVRITVANGDEIVDMIEFHVFRDGRVVASEAEIAVWLRGAFQDVLAQSE